MKFFIAVAPLLLAGCAATSGGTNTAVSAGTSNGGTHALSPQLEAQRDIAAGKLKLKESPHPSPAWWGEYHELLKKRCGIEVESVFSRQGDNTPEIKGYNQIMRARIEKRFGVGIIGKLQEEAKKNYFKRLQLPL